MSECKFSDFFTATTGNAMSRKSPFLWAGLIWGVFALAISVLNATNAAVSAKWFLGTWILCMVDLAAMAKAIASALMWMSLADQPSGENQGGKTSALMTQAIFWGTTKVLCLGLFGVVLWSAKEAPHLPLLSGLATLLVVPLFGGFWWSQKELNYA